MRLLESIKRGEYMDSLNPQWLSIEMDSIDATMENWSPALWASFQAATLTLAGHNIAQAYLNEKNDLIDEIVGSLRF